MSFGVRYSPTINKQSFIASETTGKFGRFNSGFTTGTKYAPSMSEQSYIMNMIQNYGSSTSTTGSTGSTGTTSNEDIHIVNQEVLGFTGKVDNIDFSSTLKASIKTSDVLCELNGPLSNGSIYTFGKNIPDRIVCIGDDNTSPPYSGSISYSDDNGDSWTNIDPTLFGFGKCVIWTGQIWLAGISVASSGVPPKYSLGWSLDGTTWFGNKYSENSTPIFSECCNGLACIKYQNYNRFLAVGNGRDNTIATSYDGLYWSGEGNTIFADSGNGVAWNGNIFVAVGEGIHTVAYSTNNGESWNGLGTTIFDTSGNGVAWNGEMWVAVGSGTNTIVYSYDGTIWTGADTTNIFDGGAGLSVAWNGKIWVAGGGVSGNVSGSVNTLAYSEDGKNWTTIIDIKFTGTSSYCRSITWSASSYKFIAVGSWQNTENPAQPFGIATSVDGKIWTPNYVAAFNGYGVIANSLRENTVTIPSNLNIAVGTGNYTIAYSEDDGITWTGVANPSPALFSNAYSVVFNGKIWVVGGEGNNTIAYSRTGKDWTGISNNSINSPFKDGACRGLAWDGKRFVGVGLGISAPYSIETSEDGICWTGVEDSTTICQEFNGVTWNGRIFVAVGSVNSGLNNSIATSEDGKIWIPVLNSTTVFSGIGNGVAWNGEIWVAVGVGTNTIAYSYNGTIWTGADSTTNIFTQGYSVAWNGEVWIAVGNSPSTTIAYSRNGINWTGLLNSSTILAVGRGISWTGNRFVAVGDGTNSIVWSKDGINNWTGVTNSTTNIFTSGYGVAWSALKNSVYINQPIVMGGVGTNQLVYLEDGINWVGNTGNTIFGTSGVCFCLCWNGELWVAGGGGPNSSNTMAYSYDGKSWTGLGNSIFSQTSSNTGICYSIYWNGSMFVATGGQSYSIVWSNDGKSWTGIENSVQNILARPIRWNGKMWIAAGTNTDETNAKVAKSIDGKTWDYYDITTVLDSINSISWNGLLWVAVGTGNNSIAYSDDGTTWTGVGTTTKIFSDGGASVAWNGNRFVAVGSGSSNKVAWSDDGTSWFGLGTNFFDSINYPTVVSWVGNQWIIVSATKNYYYTSQNGINWNPIDIDNYNQIPADTNLISGIFGIASNSLVGPVIVDSKIVINPGESLDAVSDSYYNTGYTNMSMNIASTYSS